MDSTLYWLWLAEAVQTPNDGVGVVQVSCARPRRTSTQTTSPASPAAPAG